MHRHRKLLPGLLALLIVVGATAADLPADEMGFEKAGDPLAGWGGSPPETIARDTETVLAGHGSARIRRDAASSGHFTAVSRALDADFGGRTIELRGFLRTADVTGWAGLWMRQDGDEGVLEFDNMQRRNVTGTTDWAEYAVALPLDPGARRIHIGFLMSGEGTTWADSLRVLVDGRPLDQAPGRERTVLDRDTEFDDSSSVPLLFTLTADQADHVALLGRVWGFLKYHHPAVASGEFHWDYELFRILPRVLDAADLPACQAALVRWIDRIGLPPVCEICPEYPDQAHLVAPVGWLHDEDLLGADLAARLQAVYESRAAGFEQFYVSQSVNVGNPIFQHESDRPRGRLPDAGYRILAVMRYWNMIEYWFPYRDLADQPWPQVLREALPRVVGAWDRDQYQLEMMALIARVRDTHANLWSAQDLRPPRGDAAWPVVFRMVEGRPTVVAFSDPDAGPGCGFEIGDAVLACDGQLFDELAAAWAPYYCASNRTILLRDIARTLPRGPAGPGNVTVERAGRTLELSVERVAGLEPPRLPHDRPGDTFQLLSPEVAYIKLSSVAIADVPSYIARAQGTRGLVVDIRNYPSEFMVFSLAPQLLDEPTEFARFTAGDLANPGVFRFGPPVALQPAEPGYPGQVAILVDESSISQAEYTAMAMRCGPRAVVVGSTTAGADGNVSRIALPGGLSTIISGIGVFYPDNTPTQQVGILPDIEAWPTVAGIKAGRDEVLEAAIRHLLGVEADEAAIAAMARRPAD
ncbi:MAG: S41 family peptidase [Candidatus Krumholzibacteriia bacterium]